MRRFGVLSIGLVLAASTFIMGASPPAFAGSMMPSVKAVAPAHGPLSGGTTVAITGKNIVGAIAVNFGSSPATNITPKSNSTILAMSPAGTGTVDITVTTPNGTSAITSADEFTYVTTPAIQSIVPKTGATIGGNRVTIAGSDFTGATSVMFGSTPAANFMVQSDQAITAITPPEAVGTVDVTVTGPDGTTPIDPADHFTFAVRVPRVTSVAPDVGPEAGGTQVTVTGSGFTKVTEVDFGSTPAGIVSVNSSKSITVTSPPGTGTVDVTVTAKKGTSIPTAVDQFTYSPPS